MQLNRFGNEFLQYLVQIFLGAIMKKPVLSFICLTLLLTGCLATTPVEMSSKEISNEVLFETTEGPSFTETTLEETTTIEQTEHNSVLTLKQIDFDGELPDGEYFVMISSFDEDCKGAYFYIKGYWRISDEEYNNILIGDTLVIGKNTYEWTEKGLRGEVYTEKQRNGYWYIRGYEDSIYTYKITENHHLYFDAGIEIYSDVQVYGQEKPSVDLTTKSQYESAFKYNNIQEYIRDVTENGGTLWGCHIIVENGVVTQIYANPQLHQPWMKQEIWEKYHSN